MLSSAGRPARDVTGVSLEGLDWDRLVAVAVSERAVAAVSAVLEHSDTAFLPEVTRDTLRRVGRGSQMRLAYMAQRLSQTERALAAANIPVVLLKGAAVARLAYRSLAERPMSDLDLLVPPEHAEAAYAVALRTGWQASEYVVLKEFYQGHYHLPPLRDERAPDIALELHRDILPSGHPFEFSAADIWRDAVSTGSEQHARVPSAVHQALHLCIHFAWSHMLSQGAWRAFSDLAQLVREAQTRHATASCYWTLRLAHDLGGVALPIEVLDALQPPGSALWRGFVARHLITVLDPLGSSCPSTRLKRALLLTALAPDVEGRTYLPPWDREHLFVPPEATEWTPRRQHLRRRLTRTRPYLRWIVSLVLGRPWRRQSPVGAVDATQAGPGGEPPTRTSPGLAPTASAATAPDPSSK